MSKVLTSIGLLAVGFVGGVLGLSAYSGTPLSTALVPGNQLASARTTDACQPEEQEQQEEIFFLSCGGIF